MKKNYNQIKLIQIILSLLLSVQYLQAQYDSGTIIYSESGTNSLINVLKNYTIGDFDSDGYSDVFVLKDSSDITPNQLRWYKGDGDGQFTEQNSISNIDNGYQENEIFYVNMNSDDNKDIVMQTSSTGFSIYFGDGEGEILSQSDIMVSIGNIDEVKLKKVADIDGDNDMDVLLWSRSGSMLFPVIGYNDGNGNFSNYIYLENQDEEIYNYIETGDLDGDGDLDIFCSGNKKIGSAGGFGPTIYLMPFVRWYENMGSGNFASKQEIALPLIDDLLPDFTHIKINDIDNDGNDELLIEYAIKDDCEDELHQINCVYLYRFHILDYDDQQMTFVIKEEYNSWLHGYTLQQNVFSHEQFYTEAFLMQFGDNDGNGNTDVLSINVPQGRLQWFCGDGLGGFDNPKNVHLNNQYSSFKPGIRVADIDNDQDLDIFVLMNTPTSSTLTVFKNLTSVGIKDILAKKVNIGFIPNPSASNSHVTLSLPKTEWVPNLPYTIRNAMGKTVSIGVCENGKIFISSLPQGIFFVEITGREKRYIGKLVVN